MSDAIQLKTPSIRVKPYAVSLAMLWAVLVASSLAWSIRQAAEAARNMARVQGRDSVTRDVVYRHWNAGHGGVYVPVTDGTPPNPHLDVPGRDVTTVSGQALTLVNPAYMTRQVHEIAADTYGIRGHITSLDPIRPANAPDSWETGALKAFANGAREVSSLEEIDGDVYLRFMQPLVTEKACLRCHAKQGYKIGDIRGGISVAVPMAPFREAERAQVAALAVWHALLLVVGLAAVGVGARQLSQDLDIQAHTKHALVCAKQEWERTFDAVPDLIAILNAKHRIVRVNRAMAERVGLTPEAMTGLECYRHIHGTETPPANCPHARLLADGREHVQEVHEEKLGGHFLVTATPFRDADGALIGSVHVARDITRRKMEEEQRKKLNLLNEELIALGGLPDKLRMITDGIVELFGADFARIWMVGPGDLCDSGCPHAGSESERGACENRETCLHLVASSGRYTHTDGGHRRVPFGAHKIGLIAGGMQTQFLTNDVVHDPEVHDHDWAAQLGLRSFAGYRLLSETGKPIGVLALFSRQPISPTTNAQLHGLANTASHVIENALKEDALRDERDKLQVAMERIKVLNGLLPICSSCKRIRDDTGYWNQIESYIHDHSDAEFSHGICPDCARKLYPKYMAKIDGAEAGKKADAG